jgi:ATP-dependent helicase YprA (DUF1998 family)
MANKVKNENVQILTHFSTRHKTKKLLTVTRRNMNYSKLLILFHRLCVLLADTYPNTIH